MGKISVAGIYYYPLKSGHGVATQSADILQTGIQFDRMATLVAISGKDKGSIITQRTKGAEKLAEVHTTVSPYDSRISFSARGNGYTTSHIIDPAEQQNGKTAFQIFGNIVQGYDAGDVAAYFFSDFLGMDCRLVLYGDSMPRTMTSRYAKEGDIVSFADGSPLHIATLPSLRALQPHFKEGAGVTMERFRPNIVLDGNLPFEEDVIHHLRIGDVEIEITKPCERCKITTIDQERGISMGKEPLSTLARFRKGDDKEGLKGVFFGVDAIPRSYGVVKVGDSVEILSTRPVHPALAEVELGYRPV